MSAKLYCRFCLEEISAAKSGERPYLFLKSEDSMKHGTLGKGISFEPILANNFPDLNPNLTKEPVVCRTCADSFMITSLFKFKILESEEKVKKASAKSNRRYVNLRTLVNEDYRKVKLVCRTCLQLIKGGKFRPVRSQPDGGYDQLVMSLLDCFPKINFNISENPLICQSCIYESERYCRFRAQCYKTEKLILDYLARNDMKFGSSNLSQIAVHLKKLVPVCGSSPRVKRVASILNIVPPKPLHLQSSPEVKQYCAPVKVKSEPLIEIDDSSDVEEVDCLDDEMHIKTENQDTRIEDLIDYEFDEDIERKINLQPPWEQVDPLADGTGDDTRLNVSPGNLVKVLIKEEPPEDFSDDLSEYYTVSSIEDAKMEHLPKKDPTETCVKTCVKCLDTNDKCNHMKKDLVWYNCPMCSYQTHWKHHLNRHKLIHGKSEQKDKYFRCRQCMFKSPFKHVIMRHNTVSHAKDFKCDECPFITKFKFTLTEHIKSTHRPDELLHKCPECPYTSKWKYHIKRHMYRHSFK